MISLRTHNIIDYVLGVVLVLCPSVFGFWSVEPARTTFLILGFGLIGYSLLTDYTYSLAKVIPIGLHMTFDVTLGIVLVLAPWLFNYLDAIGDGVFAIHILAGMSACALVAVTQPRSENRIARRRAAHKHPPETRKAA